MIKKIVFILIGIVLSCLVAACSYEPFDPVPPDTNDEEVIIIDIWEIGI